MHLSVESDSDENEFHSQWLQRNRKAIPRQNSFFESTDEESETTKHCCLSSSGISRGNLHRANPASISVRVWIARLRGASPQNTALFRRFINDSLDLRNVILSCLILGLQSR
jgi:hypothetical protein